jgi:type III restriction enzyme
VEDAKIDPRRIAVYCQLSFSKECPAPPSFNLFARGDGDYDRFIEGGYEHIIFNLSLQEGWDDPACAFAYIDKEMASGRQITQVIGRALRQPGARHYPDPILNTAHFYIRTDEQGVFESILKDVNQQLVSEHPAIEVTVRSTNRRADGNREVPSKVRVVPTTAIYSGGASEPIRKVVQRMLDFRSGGENTVGQGSRAHVLQEIGTGAGAHYEWIEVEHSNRVTARTIFKRELQRLYAGGVRRAGGPINLIDIELSKLDALIEINSPAAQHVKEIAGQAVDAFIEHSYVIENDDDVPYSVGPIAVDGATAVPFSNAIHSRYSGQNKFELAIAKTIDRTQRVWCRNPENSGYFIPLLDCGSTTTFYPDFLVWVERSVVAIDTKGDHLLNEDARRKLFDIHSTGERTRLALRIISEGYWNIASSGQLGKKGPDGYTVWRWRNGKLSGAHCKSEKAAVEVALDV